MADIKLFVCCHQPPLVPDHPLLVPIQVGAALAKSHFPGVLYDDTGENISWKNRSYCELTAQYWAWKNVKADYYGFFHYRRYLYPDVSAKRPYRIEQAPTLPLLDKLGYSDFEKLIEQYDLILPKGEDMYLPVREHYAAAPFHHRCDLERMERIVRERHPEFAKAMEEYFDGTVSYFGNIYIMRRPVFEEYCSWLFPVLEEFDRLADTSAYGSQEKRVDGYLAERLLGAYAACQRRHASLRVLELPRVFFASETKRYWKQRILSAILPPGTRRRAAVKTLKVGRGK